MKKECKFRIEGGFPLSGTISAKGNKNSALPIIAASLMVEGGVQLENVPRIDDVHSMVELIQSLGVSVEWDGSNMSIGSFQSVVSDTVSLNPDIASKIRGSILLAAPLIHCLERVSIPLPGGDRIGRRRLDTHKQVLEALGVLVTMTTVSIDFRRTSPLQGKAIWLDEASVTGTEQGIMAAVIAQGETVMSNVASEPHVQDLCNFLILHGAQIKGVGTNQLVINGVEKLISCGKPFRLGNDFMEEGSLIVAGFATRGNIILEGCDLSQHHMMRLMFQKLGYELDEYVGSLRVNGQNLGVVKTEADGAMPVVKSAVWPGFNTDLLPALVTLATQANGKVMFHETLFDNRFIWTENLRRMGGDITMCDPHRVIVQGHTVLRPAPGGIQSPDIRAGMALLIACLATPGMHTVDNIYQIDRGYENIDARLNELGARIERIEK